MRFSIEQVADAMIRYLQRNAATRAPLGADISNGSQDLVVTNTWGFQDADTIVLMDSDGNQEYHTILLVNDTTSITLYEPVQRDFTTTKGSIIQKAIGGYMLPHNQILFGDRAVIPNEGVSITVETGSLDNTEWMVIQGGLSVQYNLQITVYFKLDETERAFRVTTKYGDFLFNMLVENIHMDIINDEVAVTSDVSIGDTVFSVASTTGWTPDEEFRYEIQDNNGVEIDFSLTNVTTSPDTVQVNRPTLLAYTVADKAVFRRRVRYIYNSMAPTVTYGYIQKTSGLYKAARIEWWGREERRIPFPQQSKTVMNP